MSNEKQKQLGWVEGTAADFLGLSAAEEQLVEIKLAMANAVKSERLLSGISQADLAAKLGTKQPGIARLEKGVGASATLDLMILALLELGVDREKVSELVRDAESPRIQKAAEQSKAATRSPAQRPLRIRRKIMSRPRGVKVAA